jgi:hypothetical protein
MIMQIQAVPAVEVSAALLSAPKVNCAENVHSHVRQPSQTSETLKALLIALCTCGWEEFMVTKSLLARYSAKEVCDEAGRLRAKNSRGFRLLSVIWHNQFFSDWDCIEATAQWEIYSALTRDSINKNMKETVFHKAAKAIRKVVLSRQDPRTPTKIRLRNCHLAIATFMHEYALASDLNRAIVIAALNEGEETGCGHLPSQQAVSLIRKLTTR